MNASAQGAAEIVLRRAESVVDASGRPVLISPDLRRDLEHVVTDMASAGLRTLCLAVRDFPLDKPMEYFDIPPAEALTICCIVGIKVRHCASHIVFGST